MKLFQRYVIRYKTLLFLLIMLQISFKSFAMQAEDFYSKNCKRTQDNPVYNSDGSPRAVSPQRRPSPARPHLMRTDSASPLRAMPLTQMRAALFATGRHSIGSPAEIPARIKKPIQGDSPRVAMLKLRTSNNRLSPRSAEEIAAIFDVPCDAKRAVESIDLEALGLELTTAIKKNQTPGKGIALDGIEEIARQKIARAHCAQQITAARREKIQERGRLRRTNTIG